MVDNRNGNQGLSSRLPVDTGSTAPDDMGRPLKFRHQAQ